MAVWKVQHVYNHVGVWTDVQTTGISIHVLPSLDCAHQNAALRLSPSQVNVDHEMAFETLSILPTP